MRRRFAAGRGGLALAPLLGALLFASPLAFATNADLSLRKTVDDVRPFVGDEITFTIRVRNDGPLNARRVEVTDRLDPGFTYVRDTGGGDFDPVTGVWKIGRLACYESVSLDITVRVNAQGPYVNTAEVTRSSRNDPDSTPGDGRGDDFDSVEVRPRKLADLSLDKTVDDPRPFVGEEVTFTVSVTNDGPSRATWLDVTDRLTPGFTYVRDDAGGVYDPTTGLWSIGRLDAGHTVRLNLTAVVNPAGPYVNTAEVTFSDQKDPDSTPGDGRGDDFASVEVFPQARPPIDDLDDDDDGITDIEEGDGSRDSDGDGHPDSRDIDSDNDGIVDNEEAQPENGYVPPSGVDTDGDGLDDAYDAAPADPGAEASTGLSPVNTDGTDLPDYLDLDTDNDTVPDRTEGHDANMDGQPDNLLLGTDADGDGLDDGYDIRTGDALATPDASNAPRQDTDGDGIRDWRDPDDDDDGLPTEDEDPNGNGDPTDDDSDEDGTPNYLDPDRLPASIAGSAWLDADADEVFGPDETPAAGWILELLGAGPSSLEVLVDREGNYRVTDLTPGTYRAQVRNPENRAVFALLENIVLAEETDLLDQNLPIQPSGTVYDALARVPVAGARIRATDAAGSVLPAVCFLADQQDQRVGNNGFYRFDFILGTAPACPSGAEYRLAVSAPGGFTDAPSRLLPPQGTLDPTGRADPLQVVPQQLAPQAGESTVYHLGLLLEVGDPDVINNHIPLDPLGGGGGDGLGLRLLKRADRAEASVGDLVRYTVTAAHGSAADLFGVTVIDELPPGFNFVAGSARLNGEITEALSLEGRTLTFDNVSIAAGLTMELTYLVRIGAGVTQGDYVNTVRVEQSGMGLGTPATAVVTVVGDPDFEQTTVIGTVWDDRNGDGWQDPGENGIAGVRLATLTGLLIETDRFGRFHAAAVDVEHLARGRNFYLKVDPATLPPGTTFTTENPRVKRITQGLMNRFDFGVRLPPGEASALRRLQLGSVLFRPGSAEVTDDAARRLAALSARVSEFDCGVLSIDARAGSCPVMALNTEEYTLTSQFGVLSAELTEAYRRELEAVAESWERRRITRVTVIGHASSEPIRERSRHLFADNYVLSEARARAAARYLSELLNVPLDMMEVEGRGPDEPVASNATEAGRMLNRRAEVRIVGEPFVGCSDTAYDSAELAERRSRIVLEALSPTPDGRAVCAVEVVDAPPADAWPPLSELTESAVPAPATTALLCEGCAEGVSFEVSSLGDVSGPTDDEPSQRRAVVSADLSMLLPSGGSIWVTEDPAVVDPRLAVIGPARAGLRSGRLVEPIAFAVHTNYPDFIDRLELRIYRAADTDRVEPVAVLAVERAPFARALWEGEAPFEGGEEIAYVLRAYGEGAVDETAPAYLLLEDRVDVATQDEPDDGDVVTALYAQGGPARQNIALNASRVRLRGREIDPLATVVINDQQVPLDATGRMAVDYLVPPGEHAFNVAVTDGRGRRIDREFTVDTSGDYMFVAALADLTASESDLTGSVEPLSADDRFADESLVEGRLAFYLKGKIRGRYLLTAQLDTEQERLGDLVDNLNERRLTQLFRRLDPDRYYPVYGDDSTTIDDTDTLGKFYVRLDWDRSQLLWGNYHTGITGTEFAQYNRSLYGARLEINSGDTTESLEPVSHAKLFVSEPDTALGHDEFLGTGGSLYYLRHTNILTGSDKARVEIRDRDTGRVVENVALVRGTDYEVDELQGRILLSRPLQQTSRQFTPSIIRDEPLDGNEVFLLVDYEYLPAGFDDDVLTTGGRGRQWLGDHVAIGATYVDEARGATDYQLAGADLTLRAGQGTYLKIEGATTESSQTNTAFSDNGGLSFLANQRLDSSNGAEIGPSREGDAVGIEGRMNFDEMGLTNGDWVAGAWWRKVDAGFSVARSDLGVETEQYGFEVAGTLGERVRLSARASITDRKTQAEEQRLSVQMDYETGDRGTLSAELRQVEDTTPTGEVGGSLGAVRYTHEVRPDLSVYTTGQFTLSDDGGAYDNNDRLALGARLQVASETFLQGEYSDGHRGDATSVVLEHALSPHQQVYGSYTQSADRTDASTHREQFAVGHRTQLSDQTRLFTESQFSDGDDYAGVAHVFGLDFNPTPSWSLGFSVQQGELDSLTGLVDRDATSLRGGYQGDDLRWHSAIEYRDDTGSETRTQWLATNRLDYKVSDDFTLLAKLNYSETDGASGPTFDAKFVEGNLGFAYRPSVESRFNVLGKYTYLYDLQSFGQALAGTDQRSNILSVEGIYRLGPRWDVGAKFAARHGELRESRGAGQWYDSETALVTARASYHLLKKWDALLEYRRLEVEEDDSVRDGFLVGVDRHIGEHFKLGIGYNFTEFSDDLRLVGYEYEGWYLNVVGKY